MTEEFILFNNLEIKILYKGYDDQRKALQLSLQTANSLNRTAM